MRTVSLANAKAKLATHVDECADKGPLVITRSGKPIAVLFSPVDEDDLERFLLARSPRFQALLDRSRKSFEEGKGMSEEEFWNAVDKRTEERKKKAASNRGAKR